MIEIKRKENESASSMIYRFTRKIQQSGVLKEAKKRRFYSRGQSRLKRKMSAIHREERRVEVQKQKKLGIV